MRGHVRRRVRDGAPNESAPDRLLDVVGRGAEVVAMTHSGEARAAGFGQAHGLLHGARARNRAEAVVGIHESHGREARVNADVRTRLDYLGLEAPCVNRQPDEAV